jgi:hypothetical protein
MKAGMHLVAVVSVMGLWAPPAFSRAPKPAASHREQLDRREIQARALFARGDYQGALDLYVTLFAEKGDPIYLRNIGRCHQKLEQPEKAINSFRDYLERGHVTLAERSEVEGFIDDMEQLQKRQHAAATQAPTTPPTPTPTPTPTPAVEPTPAPSPEVPGAVLTQEAPTELPAAPESITGHWWFWTGLAVAVAAGAVGVYAATRTQPGNVPPCVSGAGMYCSPH